MKNRNLNKSFWTNAANSLPAPVRARYRVLFERAERWELAIDAVVEGYKGFTRQLHSLLPHAH